MRTFKILSILAAFALFMVSCEAIDNARSARLIIKATDSPLKSALADASTSNSSIVLEAFLINIKDIELELDDDYRGPYAGDDDGYMDDDDDIKIPGPYLIDFLSSEVLNGKVIDDFELPNVVCEEIEFHIAPYRLKNNDKMQNRSLYVEFTMNDKTYHLWTNKVAELEIEFDDDDDELMLSDHNVSMLVDLSLKQVRTNLAALPLHTAVDGNNNGIIEIGHDDDDGNNQLAESVLNIFKML